MIKITRHGIIKYLFIDDIYPLMKHMVTGESKKLTNVEEWNRVALSNRNSYEVYKKVINGIYNLTQEEEDLLWVTGWGKVNSYKWEKEEFEIGD
jgi:hypothetical protein